MGDCICYTLLTPLYMDQSAILLTYKRKMLVMRRDFIRDRHEKNTMHFISGIKSGRDSFEQAIRKTVVKETGIQLQTVQLLSHNETDYFFHAELSDRDVNNMVRCEGQLLEFFSYKELQTLLLSDLTKLFIEKHKDLLEKVDQE